MTEMTTYAPGTPCWVDLASPDIDASAEFYGALFGWEAPERDDSEQLGGYRRATLGEKAAAGMMPLMQEGQPPAWSSYVSVEDAAATTAAVREAGGAVIVEPMAVMDFGTMAVFTDPTGAFFGIWQPGSFPGSEVVNEPSTFTWSELNTRDPEASKEFYAAVFGWATRDIDMGEGGTYTVFHREDPPQEGEGVAGMLDMRGRVPDEVPAHWLAYFAVDDRDAAAAKAKEMGAEEIVSMDMEMGKLAILRDPQGAVLGIWEQTSG
jgi:uncharacterized protein